MNCLGTLRQVRRIVPHTWLEECAVHGQPRTVKYPVSPIRNSGSRLIHRGPRCRCRSSKRTDRISSSCEPPGHAPMGRRQQRLVNIGTNRWRSNPNSAFPGLGCLTLEVIRRYLLHGHTDFLNGGTLEQARCIPARSLSALPLRHLGCARHPVLYGGASTVNGVEATRCRRHAFGVTVAVRSTATIDKALCSGAAIAVLIMTICHRAAWQFAGGGF